jgi:L-alanine-DL-glutamate epimerase-like enolase superfamily enzyme
MKVTGVKTTLYAYELDRCMGDANSPSGRVRGSGCVVELLTDEELTGVAVATGGAISLIKRLVEGVLTGSDPRSVQGLFQRMNDVHFKGGHDGLVNDAIAALDVALWDLKAKIYGEPLWKILGGDQRPIHCYASGIELPMSDHGMSEWYSRMHNDYGFRGGKLKVGLEQDADLRRIGLMQDALGGAEAQPMLLIDANEYWSPKQAIRKVREMEELFDLTWVEEPARRWDFRGLRRVKDGVKTAVCAGENLDILGDFLAYFHHDSVDVIQVSYGMGGITCALQIADAAYGHDLPVTLGGSPGMIHAHLASIMPNFMTMEVVDPEPKDGVFTTDVRIEDGRAYPGDRPGNGLQIDYDALERQRVEVIPAGAGPSPLGRREGAGLYEVTPSVEERAVAKDTGLL